MTAEHKSTSMVLNTSKQLWAAPAVGIYVGTDAIVAVEHDGSIGVRWILAGPAPVDIDNVASSIDDLLSQLPTAKSSWRPPTVVIGFDAEFAQFKRLWGLPPLSDSTVGTALVRENASRFFRLAPRGLATSDVVIRDADQVWAAAVDTSVVRAVEQVCQNRRVALKALVPVESLPPLSHVPPDVLTDRASVNAWRLSHFARAAGSIDFNTAITGASSRRRSPRRERLAAVTVAVATMLVATLPVLDARRAAHEARRHHAELKVREAAAMSTVAELREVDDALTAMAQAQKSRRHSIDVLAHLTATLPPGAVITHLQIDSLGGHVTALASSADGVIKGLSASPMLLQPEIIGPVTRDRSSGREFDRLSVRFRLPESSVLSAANRGKP